MHAKTGRGRGLHEGALGLEVGELVVGVDVELVFEVEGEGVGALVLVLCVVGGGRGGRGRGGGGRVGSRGPGRVRGVEARDGEGKVVYEGREALQVRAEGRKRLISGA